jgi:hypothetical protein
MEEYISSGIVALVFAIAGLLFNFIFSDLLLMTIIFIFAFYFMALSTVYKFWGLLHDKRRN